MLSRRPWTYVIVLLLFLTVIFTVPRLTLALKRRTNNVLFEQDDRRCFCQLGGRIDDCLCDTETVDHFNNVKIFPRLQSLLEKPFFRYFQYNAKKTCPFWNNEIDKCRSRTCGVQSCRPDEIPPGLKESFAFSSAPNNANHILVDLKVNHESDNTVCADRVDDHISDSTRASLARWQKHDDDQRPFCDVDDEHCPDCDYVDLTLNPERFTGYSGEPAHKIWRAIYEENCFSPARSKKDTGFSAAFLQDSLESMCLEKRAFYRAVSGLHTSITIHLCANYLMKHSEAPSFIANSGDIFGPNLNEFLLRFDPNLTNNQGPFWLRNLYFVYLLELRALYKAAPLLERQFYYTGNVQEDNETLIAVKELLNLTKSFSEHFDESLMFNGSGKELREEFRMHFFNISRIMDCVSCDKCKLWGKLQITGLGTALKILFDDAPQVTESHQADSPSSAFVSDTFNLSRNEIVALFNAFGRISTSIRQLEKFREMIETEQKTFNHP